MESHCSSERRCYSISCEPCAWRYTLNISRRILACDPQRLFAVTVAPSLTGPKEFRDWRICARNLIDHRRRESRWWCNLGLSGWLGSDGHVRGLAILGSVLEDELLRAFERRWPTALRRIEVEDVRREIYFAMRPGIIFDTGPHHSRYQQVRICIEPSGKVRLTKALTEETGNPHPEDDAMAVVL